MKTPTPPGDPGGVPAPLRSGSLRVIDVPDAGNRIPGYPGLNVDPGHPFINRHEREAPRLCYAS
jgi:hypothetical protein